MINLLLKCLLPVFVTTFLFLFGCTDKNQKDEKDGAYIEYHDNGKISLIAYYKNMKLNGTKTLYYENGNIQSITNYNDNKIEGKKMLFHENGNLMEIYTYKDGNIDGIFYKFYDNGKINNISYMRDTIISGKQFFYYENGIFEMYRYLIDNKLKFYKRFDTCGSYKDEGGYLMHLSIVPNKINKIDIKLMPLYCAKSKIEILEVNDKDTVKTCKKYDPEDFIYTIRDTTKNIWITAYSKDLQTGHIYTESLIVKPPGAKMFYDTTGGRKMYALDTPAPASVPKGTCGKNSKDK